MLSKAELKQELKRESRGVPDGQENWKDRNGRSRKAEGRWTNYKRTVGTMQRKDWVL